MNALSFRLFLLTRLPLAFVAGVRLGQLNRNSCLCDLKESWINRNPFSSMYFAAMQMAAELCTGALLFQYMRKEPFGMLLISNTAHYHKRAKGRIRFRCLQGEEVVNALTEMSRSMDAIKLVLKVEAHDKEGDLVAEFSFEWSLKKKT